MRPLLLILLCGMLCSCSTTATQYKVIDGKMVEVERLRLQGIGNRKATFSDKSKIECDSGLKVPTIKIEDLRMDD